MSRNPFVWEIQVRREVLDDEIARLREVPYSLWKDVLTKPISKVVNGRDDKPYRCASPPTSPPTAPRTSTSRCRWPRTA